MFRIGVAVFEQDGKFFVDEGLIGGLTVQVGSRMIDASVRTKLRRLDLIMKGVGV